MTQNDGIGFVENSIIGKNMESKRMRRIVELFLIFIVTFSLFGQIVGVTDIGILPVEAETPKHVSTIPIGSRILLSEDVNSLDYLSPDAVSSGSVDEAEHIVLEKPLVTGLNTVHFTTKDQSAYDCNFHYKGRSSQVDFTEEVYDSQSVPQRRRIVANTRTIYDNGVILDRRCVTYDYGEIICSGWRRTIPGEDGGHLEYAEDYYNTFDFYRSKILYDKDGNEKGHFYISSWEPMYDNYSINWGNKEIFGMWDSARDIDYTSVIINDEDGYSYNIKKDKNGNLAACYNGEEYRYEIKSLIVPDTILFPSITVTGNGDEKKFDFTTKKEKVTRIISFQKVDDTLVKAILGKNITTIDAKAFCGCKKLKTIVIKSTKIKKIGKGAFKNINKNATIKLSGTKAQKARIKKLIKQSGIAKTVRIK
jgi:hypothetical protein